MNIWCVCVLEIKTEKVHLFSALRMVVAATNTHVFLFQINILALSQFHFNFKSEIFLNCVYINKNRSENHKGIKNERNSQVQNKVLISSLRFLHLLLADGRRIHIFNHPILHRQFETCCISVVENVSNSYPVATCQQNIFV